MILEATAVVAVNDAKLVKKSKSDDNIYIEIMIELEYGQNIKYNTQYFQ